MANKMKRKVIDANLSYTFSDYFNLNADTEEVLAYFGFLFEVEPLELPASKRELERLEDLQMRLEENLSMVNLTNEIARREFLIAPVLSDVARQTHGKIKLNIRLKSARS